MNFQEIKLLDVVGSGNIHRCREIEPHEATIYSLQTGGLDTFSAISKTELILTVDGTLEDDEEQQKNKRKQYSVLELPVAFSKESVLKVIIR